MKIGLLQCDHVAARFAHLAGDYPAMFGALLPQVKLTTFAVCDNEWPASLDECDGWLATGSARSVYEEIDWIVRLKEFIRQLHAARKPYVGICFGHQMLAEALGGHVAKAPQGWGVGVHPTDIVRAETWMEPSQSSVALQYSHQDQVQHMPDDGVLLGQAAHCPIAIFRVNQTLLGIQAHPEFPHAYSYALIASRQERIGLERAQAALASLSQPTDESRAGQWIIHFLEQAQAQSSRSAAT